MRAKTSDHVSSTVVLPPKENPINTDVECHPKTLVQSKLTSFIPR